MKSARLQKTVFSIAYGHFLVLLRRARVNAGLTQADAARRLKKPQSFISKCESGERRVDVVELIAFCRAYESDPIELLRRLERSLGNEARLKGK